jgi:hypothetical protein
MISRTAFCSAQAATMRLARTGPIPSTSRRRSGWVSIVNRSDAADHAGGKILLDPIDRGWRGRPQESCFELLAMGAIVDPFSRRRNPFAGRNGCGVTDHGHEVPVPARLRPQDAKAIVSIVEGDALDETRQHIRG